MWVFPWIDVAKAKVEESVIPSKLGLLKHLVTHCSLPTHILLPVGGRDILSLLWEFSGGILEPWGD